MAANTRWPPDIKELTIRKIVEFLNRVNFENLQLVKKTAAFYKGKVGNYVVTQYYIRRVHIVLYNVMEQNYKKNQKKIIKDFKCSILSVTSWVIR